MKKGKGLIALLLSVTLILTLFSGVAFAEGEDVQDDVQITEPAPETSADGGEQPTGGCIEGCVLPEGHEGECILETQPEPEEDGLVVEDPTEIEPDETVNASQAARAVPANALTAEEVMTAEDLEAALEAGGEVTLGASIELAAGTQFNIENAVTLDLNGFSITRAGDSSSKLFSVKNNGSLTLNDSKGGGAIQSTYPVQLWSNSAFIMNGGDITSSRGAALDIFSSASNVKVEINKGSLKADADNTFGIRGSENVVVDIKGGEILSKTNRLAIYVSGNKDNAIQLNISGGSIQNEGQAIQAYSGAVINVSGSANIHSETGTAISTQSGYGAVELNISGGNISTASSTGYAVQAREESKVNISAGTIAGGTAVQVSDSAMVNINGGTLEGKRAAIGESSGSTANIQVVSGTFSDDSVEKYLAPGASLGQPDADGNYTVTTHYIAEVDGQKYVSLADAIAVADGETVKLLDHIEDAETIEVAGTDITLDLNGKTISGSVGSSGLVRIAKGADVTITDNGSEGQKGSVINNYAGSSAYTVYIEAGAKVTLDGGIAITDAAGTSASCGSVYLKSNNNTPPELIVKDAILTSSKGYAIRLERGMLSSNVTIEGGEFQVTGRKPDEGVIYNARSEFVTIKGGVFHNWIWDSGSLNDHNDCLAEGYGFTLGENKVVTVGNSAPADYIASASTGDRTFYLTSGNLYDLFTYTALDGNKNPVDVEVHIADDVTVTFPANSGYGVQREDDIPTLTLTVADGASLTGNFPLYVADVVLMGGNVEDNTFVSADAGGYTVTRDGNTWQGRLNDSSVALLVTHADGTTARFTEDDVALAFNNAKANPGSTITLFKDVAHGGVTVAQNLTLDLNGRTYTYNSTANAFSVKSGVTFSIVDNSENQGGTVAVSRPAINSLVCTPSDSEGAVINIGEGVTLKGCALLTGTNPTLNVYGTINTTGSSDAGIYNNGSSTDNSTINLYDGAVIEANTLGVYHPGPGTLNVYGGAEITAGDVGIEMRAGTLNVYDGAVITSTGTGEPSSTSNGSGSTSHNAAVAIAQHATKLPVVFNAYGGTFTGSASVYESNPQGNDAAAIEKITLNIENGMFEGKVESATQEGFISGGTFTVKPAAEDIYPGLQAVEDGGNFTIARLQDVYVNGAAGSDDNNGTDAQNAVKTLEHATKLVADDGTIYICGTVTVNGSLTVDGAKIERADGFDGMLISVDGANAKLTLKNTTLDGKNETVDYGSYLVFITNGGTLNIESGTELINNKTTAAYVNVDSFLNMNGGAIKNNTTVANFGGGGIYNVGATVINGGEISGNTASTWGGGILTERGSITLNGGEIKNNFAEQGAGLTVTGGTAVLDGATISENQAGFYGGGVYLQGFMNGGTQFEMKSGSITGNMSAMTGAGIFGYVYNGPVDIKISGGTIKDNVSTDENMGHAIGIYGYNGSDAYPRLELSGSPEIDGDIYYQNDYEDGYVIHVTGAFTPAKAIEINRSNNKEGIPAVKYAAGLTPNLEDFVSGTIFEKLVVEGQNLVWMDASIVYFYDEDGTEFKENRHGVVMGETIDPADVPTPVKEGYTLTGWYEKNAAEPWDFAADTVSKTSTRLYAQWNLNAPDIAVSADVDSPHIGTEAVLTATPSHDLDGVTYTYQWYKDGEPLTGETGNQLTVSESGSYTVKVKASDGAKESAETESAPVEITIEGHVYVPEVTAPTCTEQGYTTYTCAVCGDSYVDDYTPAEGHQGAATTPQTGDNSNMLLWIIVCIAAAGALAGTFAYKKIRAERK